MQISYLEVRSELWLEPYSDSNHIFVTEVKSMHNSISGNYPSKVQHCFDKTKDYAFMLPLTFFNSGKMINVTSINK